MNARKHRRVCWLLVVLGVCFLAPQARATLFYSVNVITDTLVTIDSDTGIVTPVGPTGHNMIEVDLAFHQGLLFGLNNDFGKRVELFALDPATGAAVAVVPLRLGAVHLLNAEGLTSTGPDLLVSFDTPDTQGSTLASNALGVVSPTTGLVSQYFDYSTLNPLADMDALGTRRTDGQVFSIDRSGRADGYLYAVDRQVPAYRMIGNAPRTDDLEFVGTRLFALTSNYGLFELSPANGDVLSRIPAIPSLGLSGLALPEPGGLLLLAAAGLLARRR